MTRVYRISMPGAVSLVVLSIIQCFKSHKPTQHIGVVENDRIAAQIMLKTQV